MDQEAIRETRTALGLSQEMFAGLVGSTGISVCRWENGKQNPTLFQVGLLRQVRRAILRRPELRERIAEAIVTRGAIVALSLLLSSALEE